MVSPNDSKINGLSCNLLCLLLLLICFIGLSNFLIMKIFLISALMTKAGDRALETPIGNCLEYQPSAMKLNRLVYLISTI